LGAIDIGMLNSVWSVRDAGTTGAAISENTLSTAAAGTVTVPSNMLTGVKLPDGSPGISGSKAEISIAQGDKTSLPEDIKAAIGDKPLVSLSLSIDSIPSFFMPIIFM